MKLTSFSIFLLTIAWVSHCSAAAPKVTVVPVPDGGRPMAARTDASGVIHVVYDTPGGPQYVSSTNNGKTLSSPIPVVDPGSRKPGLEFITWDMGVSPDGAVHVSLGTNAWKLKLPKDEWGYMYTRLLPGKSSFTPIRNINHKPSEGFSLAVGEQGLVTAVWMADKLYANVSQDGGESFGPVVEIDSSLNPCNCCTTSSVYAKDGRLAILYREETNNDRDMYLALWDQKQNKVKKSRVSSTGWKIDSCPMTYYSVSRQGDGFIAAWPTRGDIYFARLKPDGTPTIPKEIKTPGNSGMRTGISALATTDGGALVVWKKDRQLGWQSYDERGRPVGPPGAAESAGDGVAGVVAKNNEVILFR